MAHNNSTRPDQFNHSQPDNSNDEVSLQDLGIFDEPPPSATYSSMPAVTNSDPPTPLALSSPSGAPATQAVALHERTDLSNQSAQREYVEIETLPGEDLTGMLACAICYQPYYPENFTVVSKERLNFEAAVVVCPQCLTEMQTEVERRTAGADLALGAIWGVVATLIITVLMGWLIWSQRDSTNRIWWSWVQAFLAILPGWFIAKAIFIGVGRRSSVWQQLMAVGFTLFSVLVQYYIVQLAYPNFLDEITQPDGHALEGLNIIEALRRLMPAIFDAGILIALAIFITSFIGILTAWFVSEGPRLYTRPFVQPAKVSKSRLAQFRQFINL